MDPALRAVFKRIGVPGSNGFIPDQFQLDALDLVKDNDVLVSAPTGAGKTWIASQTIHAYLSNGLRVWYASPLKALSNSIYQEFRHEFGPEYCGILTGDRKENPDASVIVGTTEILRNQLYDAMHKGVSIQTDLVILDEAHYLSDPDRGVVWEEVLIYLPRRVRLLLLSATISNARQICSWLRRIRGTPNKIVHSDERPVPLETLFLFPDSLIAPLGGKKGLNPKIKKFLVSRSGRRGRRSGKIDFGNIIKSLRRLDLLPAIFFLTSRKDCDRALLSCPPVDIPPDQKKRLQEAVEASIKDYPHLKDHRQMEALLESLVSSHHGGQLPYWKILIEKMMSMGALEAIFSTSTVAAGVNFPARTVVLLQSDRFNGHEFSDLTATELHQMIGRAGRRGKDHIGFALLIPGIHQDPRLIHELEVSPADPVRSQIKINFSMTLNLLLSHTPDEVKDLLEHSFAAFQEKESADSSMKNWERRFQGLIKGLPRAKCHVEDPHGILSNIEKWSALQKERRKHSRALSYEQAVNALKEYLRPGRLFLHKNSNIYIIFQTYRDKERFICVAHNVMRTARKHGAHFQLKKIDLSQIKDVFEYQLDDVPGDYSPERINRLFDSIPFNDLKVLDIDRSKKDMQVEAPKEVRQQIESLPCSTCEHPETCHKKIKSPLKNLIRELKSHGIHTDGIGLGLWAGFKRHVRFLKETGFMDDTDRLTPDGLWASKLRLDQPLLIAEVIRKGAFEGLPPEILAGGLAPFVWDRALDVELKIKGLFDVTEIEKVFNRTVEHVEEIRRLKIKRGFDTPPIMFWPAAIIFLWAGGVPWQQISGLVSVDEGDIASLIMRTAEHLRQIAGLRETHSRLASMAENAIELIRREPVYIE